ncbi:hypothetical protein EUA93_15945 [Nocardioides oleivorans]|uniref:Bacterial bifunctional deaminase-reductase C-terminal domain-containing protein n=1 Tax=Nocardioides oleivorans TaxID=273676 RepID=A0A4Q2RUZ8_9ACTN|nr:dihydrofolate reductase family protein [Nocardioides oleivorans]RYB91649.1 hypothetical protein EUA93_15945 [Nocardioides oleivorans]
MAKLVVVVMSSVDSFYEGPGGAGDLEPTGVDDGFNGYNADVVAGAAVVVIGHSSFKDFSSYWPDRESADDASDAERRFAAAYNPLPKVVASRTPGSVNVPEAWVGNTRVVGDDLVGEVTRLKEEAAGVGGGDVVVWGSRKVWTQLWEAGLVDELHVVAGTGVAGAGTQVFPDGAVLTRLEARMLPDSQCVLSTYRVGPS